ncbi:MAG: MOSC N-terminal beta barrel domain-containing protein [Actinocatenispora sp.]
MRVTSVHIYPVKSTRGSEVAEATVEPWGLRHDRRWLLVDGGGAKVTARENSRLLLVRATPQSDGGLVLDAPGVDPLRVACPAGTPPIVAQVSRLPHVASCDPAADAWLSKVVEQPVRLGWLDDPRRRPVDPEHGGRPGDPLSLADAGPLLLTSTASLRRLDEWAAETARDCAEAAPAPLTMERFRPNVVVDGVPEAFVEDDWQRLTIGTIEFRVSESCDRCVFTTIDPATRARGHEPIRTLARHRRWDGKVWFGIRLVPTYAGTVRAGDPVTVH